jgi:hypothetical protein
MRSDETPHPARAAARLLLDPREGTFDGVGKGLLVVGGLSP